MNELRQTINADHLTKNCVDNSKFVRTLRKS